jgi:hypothetical protein
MDLIALDHQVDVDKQLIQAKIIKVSYTAVRGTYTY